METINQITKGAILLFVVVLCSCTKYNYIDGGLADGNHDCSMWDYFHLQPEDWDSTLLMIEHAGMKEWFDGSRKEQITFLGITNLAIMRFILDHNYAATSESEKWQGVKGIPADSCAAILKRLIIPQRLTVEDVPRGKREKKSGPDGIYWELTGGATYTTLKGKVSCWSYQMDYSIIPEGGEVTLFIAREGTRYEGDRIVWTDIRTTTGVVQALSYNFNFKNL